MRQILLACATLFTFEFGPLTNTPLTNVYQELAIDLCPYNHVTVRGRVTQEIQTPSGPARHVLGDGWRQLGSVRLEIRKEP